MAVRIQRTPSSSGSNSKFTFSAWVKRGTLGALSPMFSAGSSGQSQIVFDAQDELGVYDGATVILETNRVFRDTSAFYHIVVTLDATQSGTDKAKLYVNGVQETSFKTDGRSSFSSLAKANQSGEVQDIGSDGTGNFLGLMTHVHMTDNYAYPASTFGETDSTSGIWKPKTAPSVTYGTNGFFLKFENSGNLDLDSNSNGHTFSTTGTITQTEDTPSNNFATMNSLHKGANVALTNGNLTCTGSGSNASVASTLAVSSGKWYWEAKLNSSTNNYFNVGILKTDVRIDNLSYPADNAGGYVYAIDGNMYNNGSALLDTGTTISVGDIVGFLLDLDNGTLKLKKNGSDVYSGNAVVSSLNTGDFWYVAQGANPSNVDFNFGNGRFGTTALASSNSDSAGLGLFEYSVPSGYYALCTKNIKNYG